MPGHSLNILLIEDSLAEARLLQEALKDTNLRQFSLAHVKRLEEAIHYLNQACFDIILLDLTLPDSQGLESLALLNQSASSLPIVVLTNTNDEELAFEALRQGAQDYLVKRQVNPELLARAVRYAIERKQASEALREANEALEHRVQERTAELAKSNDLLRQEICERQRVQEELQRSNAELRQFAYVASHDLQEPLRTIASFVQLLAQRYSDKLDANANDYINFVVDSTKRMQELIQAILGYSRVGRSTRELELIHCDTLLSMILQHLEKAITDSNATITADPLPTVMADPVQFGQLLQNLIENALKYRSDRPLRIHISARMQLKKAAETQAENDNSSNSNDVCQLPSASFILSPSYEWLFSIRDNGIGIEPEYFNRIFLIFQRLHTRSQYAGTGIGLALCQKIVERHGGQIWVESKFGEGATFLFTLPVRDSATASLVIPSFDNSQVSSVTKTTLQSKAGN